ncbi:MAG: hypothetical protein FWC58_07100 [Desulfobulbus sp.]|nr:hypothetical protein [Desulfobulbus sp.]
MENRVEVIASRWRGLSSRRFALSTLLIGLVFLAVAAAASVTLAAGEIAPPAAIVLPAEISSRLQAGDLIFRIGDGWQSEVVRGAASARQHEKRGDPYSHVGMLVGAAGHWQVVHAVPAEMPGRADAVVRDDLDFFLSPDRARGVAIYRVPATAASRASAVEYALQRLGAPFQIVENDRQGQYCTTLVWAAWLHAGVDLGARFEHLEAPFFAGDYLLPHSLRVAPGLRLVYQQP